MEDPYDSDQENGEEQPSPSDLPATDQEFFTERLGAVTYRKALAPKSRDFDILTRISFEDQDDSPAQLCEPFNIETASQPSYSYPQFFRDTFQGNLESEDKMHISTIVGWTVENNQTLLVNMTDLGDIAEDIVPMTDTIFPVLVMGKKRLPISPDVMDEIIMDYEPGGYLLLTDCPGLGSVTVQIEAYKRQSKCKFTVNTYRAELELYYILLRWNDQDQQYWKDYRSFGKINRILDKDNADYGVLGMYAGGPLPPVKSYSLERGSNRLCWDQPRNYNSNDYGINSMEAGFRWDIDHQKGARRVGFYCSRDALLAVRENPKVESSGARTGVSTNYQSLLKEYTFVICDGFSSYAMFYGESNTQNIPFKDLDDTTLGPIIVIVPQGLSSLSIKVSPDNPHYRNSQYYNENPAHQPMVLNWKRFQEDFNSEPIKETLQTQGDRGAEQVPTGLQQIMKLEDLPDYVMFDIPSMNREYVFSLKQAPNFYPQQSYNSWPRLEDYWHVYGRLSNWDKESKGCLYYYLGTISNSYDLKYGTTLKYNRTHFQRPLFPVGISSKYSSISEQEQQEAQVMANEWRSVMKDYQFKGILRRLGTLSKWDLTNTTINADSRQKRFESIFQNVDE